MHGNLIITLSMFNCIKISCILLCLALISCGNDKAPSTTEEVVRPSLSPEIDKLNAEIDQDTSKHELFAARALALWDKRAYDEAIADMERAIQLEGDKPEYFHTLADFYIDYFRSKRALKVMEAAGLKFPERIPTLLKLSEFYLILKEYDSAHRTIDRIRKLSPLNAEMFFMEGRIYEEEGNIEKAVNAYQFATENDPDLTEAYLSLGSLYQESKPKLALQYYDNAIRTAPDNTDARLIKAYHQSNFMNDLTGAQETYREIHIKEPQNKTAWHNSGLVYLDMDSLQQAYRQFTFAIKASPSAVESYYYRGITSELQGDVSAAKDDYEQVAKMNPSFEEGRKALERVSRQVAQ